MSTTIEQLEVEVQSSATSAVSGIDALASSLGKLKTAVKGGVGLTSVAKQLTTLNTALSSVSAGNAENLNKLANGLKTLSSCGSLKLSSSVATQITNIGSAIQSLNGTNFGALNSLANALTPLANIGKSNLNSFISQLQRLPQAVQALSSVNIGSLGTQISQLVSALLPLTQMGKNNLTSFVTQLQKLPQVMTALRSVDMGALASQIQQLANALAPLATQMQSIANGFSAFPARIQRLIRSTNNLTTANNGASMSYANLAAKIGIAVVAMKRIASVIAGWITESNKYIENLNLFTVSMGEYANEAQKYAETVAEIMGIDPGEWLRNQGIFMTLATGFGVVSDRAYTMSQNLTQLGYDLSSFFNISYEDAFQKLQSGISGELEPLRRLGFDLSVARLQQEALNLGIQKNVNLMTQAEKAELRYYAIMTQVTTAQGDMARTLEAPANQLRVLKAQVTQCARSLGNIFIPVLNAVLPYAIALAKAIRLVADAIASLFGFALPEVDYSGISSAAGGVGDIADGLGDATDKAKELKNALLGIDELNIISPPEDSSGGGAGGVGGGAGGLGFELPTYDFLGDAVNSKVEEILTKMKEWLGLTEDIDTWSEFFHTRLGRILTTVGAIALGLATWKISQSVLTGIQGLLALKKAGLGNGLTLSIGLSFSIAGIALEAAGIIDAIQNELNGMNFAQILGGGSFITIGGAFIGKAVAGWITSAFSGSAVATALSTAATNLGLGTATAAGAALGAGIGGIIAGIPAYITGIYDAIKNGIDWLSSALIGAGATAAGAGIGAIIGACGGPIGAGIGALIGLAVGLVTDGIILVVQKWDVIVEFLDNFFTKTVPGLWSDFTTWLGKIPKQLEKFFKSLPGKIEDWFDDLWQPIKDYDWNSLGYNIGQWFGNAWKTAVNFVTVTIPTWFTNMWNSIKSAFKQFFTVTLPTFFTQTIPSVVSKIGEFFKALPGKIYNAFISAKQSIVDIGSAIIDGIWEGLQSIWKAITDFVDGFVQGFKDALGIHSPSTVFKAIGEDIVAGLLQGIEGFTNMMNTVKEWGASVIEWFTKGEDGKNIVDHFKEIGGNIIGGFKDKISTTYTNVKTSVTTWASKVKEWFTNSSFGGINRESFATFANNTIEGFKTKVSTAYTNVKTSITTWASKVKEWFTSSSFGGVNFSNFSTFANNTIEGFKSKISSAYTNVKSSITTWASKVKEWFTSGSFGGVNATSFGTFASNVITGFKDKISSTYSTVKSSITTWASNVKTWFTSGSFGGVNSTSFATYASNVINGFKDKISSAYTNTKSSITTWASNVKSWFSGTASSSAFAGYANDIINGFKNKIGEAYTNAKSNMQTFASNVKSWFTGTVSYSSFYSIASDVISGFKNGIGNLYSTCKNTIKSWGSDIIDWFKGVLGINSPSKVFYEMAGFSVEGFNNGFSFLGKSTKGVVSSWADSFTAVTPTMSFAVDTSALKYYDSGSFAKSVSANVTSNTSVTATGFMEGMEEFYREYVEPTMAQMAADMRRQADKNEQTIVQIGNRTVSDAVTTQQKANGFVFAK